VSTAGSAISLLLLKWVRPVETMVAGVWLTQKLLLTINSVLENLKMGSSCGRLGYEPNLVDSEVTINKSSGRYLG
jgi:hypothetical protein